MKNDKFWAELLGVSYLKENAIIKIGAHKYMYKNSVLRQIGTHSGNQSQTKDAFAFKWERTDTYSSTRYNGFVRKWLIDKYFSGDIKLLDRWLSPGAKLLDAGCGSSVSSLALFGKKLNRMNYLGVDISRSIDVAKKRFDCKGIKGEFLQADLTRLPFQGPTFDLIFSEGVLHHTDNPEKAFKSLVRILKTGGAFIFYVYRKKGPIREFTDDYVRSYLRDMDDKKAWKQLIPLTRLGKILGDMKITVNVPENIECLGIPSGKIELQRLFYWYIFKAFYRDDFDIKEMNHVNFDWYRPLNCHRFTPSEVKRWCRCSRLKIHRFNVEEAGISVIASKK